VSIPEPIVRKGREALIDEAFMVSLPLSGVFYREEDIECPVLYSEGNSARLATGMVNH
jgi:hypothetical protein